MPKILIDLNALLYAGVQSTKLSVGDMQVGGIFAVLKRVAQIRETFPGRIIALHDGRSWRKDFFADYKASRGTTPDQAEAKQQVKSQKPMLCRMLNMLGVDQMLSSNMEADDLAAKFCRNPTDDIVMITRDQDWLQLVGPKVSWFSPISNEDKHVTQANFKEVTGYDRPMQFVQAKALMGDRGDDVPPVGGIGEKGAKALMERFGSVETMRNESIMPDSNKWPAAFQRFVDSEDKQKAFERNMQLVWLHHPKIPLPKDVRLVPGLYDPDGFMRLCEELSFHSIILQFERFTRPFAPMKEAA